MDGALCSKSVILEKKMSLNRLPYLVMILVGSLLPGITKTQELSEGNKATIHYGNNGFQFDSRDGNYSMYLHWRLQFRLAYPTDTDPVTLQDFGKDELHIKIRRARMKVGGHAFTPWFNYYLEYELFASNLLDFRIMIEKLPFLKVKVGQWKAHYNRERVISSGKQQTVERSILTKPFTIDRQQGISLYGNTGAAGAANFSYWLSAFSGTGRGATTNDDEHLMYMGRLQWNPTGRIVPFQGSDIGFTKKFTPLIAMAAVTNRSPYTRFSQDGGGQLTGFEEGDPGQYRVNQFQIETAIMWRGFSWQQELHWKEIDDKKNLEVTILTGNLAQIGYFFHYAWDAIPKPLEIYFRHAIHDPDRNIEKNYQQEISTGLNWYFKGHKNKLTAEVSFIDVQEDAETTVIGGNRYRVQWDVSF